MRPGLAPRWFRGGWAGCGVFVTSSELLSVIACCEGAFAAPAPTRDVPGHDPALSGDQIFRLDWLVFVFVYSCLFLH
jgi:hypothetical protein